MPVTITVPTAKKPKTLKDAIVSFLAQEWPLSAKKLYNRVRNNGFEVSYQAVHKALKELLNDGVILRGDKAYSLNRSWIDGIKDFADGLGKIYEDESRITIEKAFEQGHGSFSFKTVYDFYVNMAKILKRLSIEAEKSDGFGLAQVKHIYWALASSQKEYDMVNNMFNSYKETYTVCRNENKADRMALDYLKTLNPKSHGVFGAKCAEDCDFFVGGDFVIQAFFSKDLTRLMDMAYKRAESLDGIKKLYGLLFNKKTNIDVIIFRNSALSEKIRKDILGYFRK